MAYETDYICMTQSSQRNGQIRPASVQPFGSFLFPFCSARTPNGSGLTAGFLKTLQRSLLCPVAGRNIVNLQSNLKAEMNWGNNLNLFQLQMLRNPGCLILHATDLG